ncbi:MAG TPA: hypothetical protein VNS58_21730 [Puia sp.]|nr:hypothetical protein [Puia sp.]
MSLKYLKFWLLIAFTLETLSVTWCLKIPGWVPLFSILYFGAGIGIAVLLLFCPVLKLPPFEMKAWKDPVNHYRLVIAGLISLVLYYWCQYWFEEIPLDIRNADMLPIIKVMGERFIAGQHSHIYDVIPWIWGGSQPIYLPAMWLPYVPAIALGIDMRWIAIAGLLFAFGAFLFVYRPHSHNYLSFFLGVIAFLLFWWVVADNTPGIISVAEEGTVIGYYVLLVLSLASGKPWLTAIAVSLCMLSRYALVGWVPAYLLYLILEKNWKPLFILILTGMLCFILLFLVPVGWTTFVRLALLPGDYIAFAGRVWKDSPEVFSTAPGFAWFFGPKRIAQLHRLLIILSFGVPVLFVVFCKWSSGKRKMANIPLAALKISLVVFYCFIDVPYLYLFYTSSFVSLIALTLLLREDSTDKEPNLQPAG